MKLQSADRPDLTLDQLRSMMTAAGAKRILMKDLAPNDNAKNQPYLSGSLDVTNILPAGDIYVDQTPQGNRIMKAPLPLRWLQPDGSMRPAPHAKLILYPQYPEVRFSGFLRGSQNAPNDILTTRAPGRRLFFGITDDRRIIGWASWGDDTLSANVDALGELEPEGVFRRIPLSGEPKDSYSLLLAELRRIHLLDWIAGKRLSGGVVKPYNASNGIGYTLEAELGISNNGIAGPDFEGWEVKAAQVPSFTSIPNSKKNTLLTPEPDGGEYTQMSLLEFVTKFGYADKNDVEDRLNFGGQFKVGKRHQLTGLTTHLFGFNKVKGEVDDVDGKFVLADDSGLEVASWSFKKLLTHWNKKHAKAVYLPGEIRKAPDTKYRYGSSAYLGEGTDFNMFLSAVAAGRVFFDPGMKVEAAASAAPKPKKRSQFRIVWKDIPSLYHKMTITDVLTA
ncbi:MvaI/BcnI family restriction endonuclease [Rhizobium ruizarguesonis]|uniref:MvaI/BcnI family restriction endonuclease n=1 Tax=Rhizobium ruizarguesonis TaxID=2081791 RepID=UPI0010324FC3|nr:MvaI/BcnI family restriction endonuclease [Rhizobium ruizarguesonis]TAW02673.1 MvaI/BcnI restriction endonuclease family protein [Rhizobium ruizarguesonis]TAZ44242.1 MvaI/BcnI restriction endonuclease family protein [Rhizobium ruizarguesonis]